MLRISSVNPEEWKHPEPKYPLPKGFKYNAVLDMEHITSNRYISKESIEIISKLFERGYWAYLYGECVLCYSRHCKNISKFTIVTNASLSELKSIYSIAEVLEVFLALNEGGKPVAKEVLDHARELLKNEANNGEM